MRRSILFSLSSLCSTSVLIATGLALTLPAITPSTSDAAREIVVRFSNHLDGEGTPFEEPEDDGGPKMPNFDEDIGAGGESRSGSPSDSKQIFGSSVLDTVLPFLSWVARLRS